MEKTAKENVKEVSINNYNLKIERKKNRIRITFVDFKENFNRIIRIPLGEKKDILELIQALEEFNTVEIKKEDKAYTEEINTYRKEVERSILLIRNSILLFCYTDVEYDDNWIELTPKKYAYLIGLLYGYLV